LPENFHRPFVADDIDDGPAGIIENVVSAAKWGLGVQFGNYPMALDDTHKRLFVGCRLPVNLVVMDTTSGRIVASFSTIGNHTLFPGQQPQCRIVSEH
jgi:hypothetical protein